MTDLRELWDFADPAASEVRLHAAADARSGAERLVLLTQVARALGLQRRFDAAHALLDGVLATLVADPQPDSTAVLVRLSLERGRLLRAAGAPADAAEHFEQAERAAAAAGLEALRIDAVSMQALVSAPQDRLGLTERALELAAYSRDPAARDRDASLLGALGALHAEAGDFGSALGYFELALAARERIGRPEETRSARWQVAWALRNLGRPGDARTMQRALREELATVGRTDPSVEAELALLGR